jgi:hypothetical protein
MVIEVSDVRSSPNEQLYHGAKILGRSKTRRRVFQEIYRGKTRIKTVSFLEARTGFGKVRVLQEAGKLADNEIVSKKKLGGETAYEKVRFYEQHKKQVLALSLSKEKLAKLPTKYSHAVSVQRVAVFSHRQVDAKSVTVDEIDSFWKVRRINPKAVIQKPGYELKFKKGLQRLLGDKGTFRDWGGETDDLFSTRVKIAGRRHSVAFGLKGRGTKGVLTPKKMGKRGDQIQRLFRSPADVFVVQYWGPIDESILEQMRSFSIARSALEQKRVYYGVIDGTDTARLHAAYPQYF